MTLHGMDWITLARRAASDFDFEPSSATPLEGGRINLNLRVDTTAGPCVLRLYPKSREIQRVRFEMDVLSRLHAQGVRVPEPLRSKSGDAAALLDEAPLAWLRTVPGRAHTVEEGLELPTQAVVELLGQVRRGLDGIEASTPPVRETATFGHSYRTLYGALHEAQRGFYATELQSRFRASERWERVAHLPTGVVHGDLHAGNLVSTGDGPLWLVDFDDLHVGWVAQDWVLAALELSLDPEGWLDLERYESLLEPWRTDWSSAEEREAEPELATLLLLKRASTQHAMGCPLAHNRYLVALLQEDS